jgi:hypothetical protein
LVGALGKYQQKHARSFNRIEYRFVPHGTGRHVARRDPTLHPALFQQSANFDRYTRIVASMADENISRHFFSQSRIASVGQASHAPEKVV